MASVKIKATNFDDIKANDCNKIVDILEIMKNDTIFYKNDKNSKQPIKLIFKLDSDNTCIIYKYNIYDTIKNVIYIRDIIDITYNNKVHNNESISKKFIITYFDKTYHKTNQSGLHTPSAHVNELKTRGGMFTIRGFQSSHKLLNNNGIEKLSLTATKGGIALIWVHGIKYVFSIHACLWNDYMFTD